MPNKPTRQQFIDSLTGEDKMVEQIRFWAEASYLQHKYSIRGQQLTYADEMDYHIMMATIRWVKESESKPRKIQYRALGEFDEGWIDHIGPAMEELPPNTDLLLWRYKR